MRPAIVTLSIYQGATFDQKVTLKEKDNKTPLALADLYDGARADIRTEIRGPLIMRLSTTDGTITLNNEGEVQFNVAAADTDELFTLDDYETWVYDLELYKDDAGVERVDRALSGVVVFYPGVTRDTP